MLNESAVNKVMKQLMKAVNDGTANDLKIALKWLCERQDFQMLGSKGTDLAYRQLRDKRLVPSHHDWLKSKLERYAQSPQGMLREAALNPHTPRHMATYVVNLLTQVRAALRIMRSLKVREHTEHLEGGLLVPLVKWNKIRQEKPHSHPFVSDLVAATISERLDKEPLRVDSAALTLLQMKELEEWLYEVPALTPSMTDELVKTAGVFERWSTWLKEEKWIEQMQNEKLLAAGNF